MSRDHRKLRVFHQAHTLTLAIFKHTRNFPRDEWFGIRAQVRRAAVSVPSNLVEGNARSGEKDYLRFLNIALGQSDSVVRQLQRLVQQMEQSIAEQVTEGRVR